MLALGDEDAKPTVGVGSAAVAVKDAPVADGWLPEAVGCEALRPKDVLVVGGFPNAGVCPTVMTSVCNAEATFLTPAFFP